MHDLFGGIDPGKKGFLSLYDGRILIESWPMPVSTSKKIYDLRSINEIFARWKSMNVKLVLIEQQGVMPRESSVGAFSSGEGFGILQMGLYCNSIPFSIVRPAVWKKEMKIPSPAKSPAKGKTATEKNRIKREYKDAVKAESLKAAQSIFPNVDFRASERCTTPSDDKAESALLAVLAYRRHK